MHELPLDHDALLTLAWKTRAAAQDGDRDRLEAAALRLFEALDDHLGAERGDLVRLAPTDSRLLLRGQQRVVDAVVELALAVTSEGPCRCDVLAGRLVAQLTLQAEDEHRHLAARRAS